MKTLRYEIEDPQKGRKLKKPRLDQKSIAQIGNALYHLKEVRAISIKVMFKNGTTTTFQRSEDCDRCERIDKRIDKLMEDEDD